MYTLWLLEGTVIALAGRAAERRARLPDAAGWVRQWTWAETKSLHEAAHLVAAYAAGCELLEASIVPDLETTLNGDSYVAGFARYARERPTELVIDNSIVGDYESARDHCSRISGRFGWVRYFLMARYLADEIVAEKWPLIRALQSALCVSKTLDRAEIMRIIRGHREVTA